MTTAAEVLDQIRDALLAEAEQALARAEQYVHSERQTNCLAEPTDRSTQASTPLPQQRLCGYWLRLLFALANRKAYGS